MLTRKSRETAEVAKAGADRSHVTQNAKDLDARKKRILRADGARERKKTLYVKVMAGLRFSIASSSKPQENQNTIGDETRHNELESC